MSTRPRTSAICARCFARRLFRSSQYAQSSDISSPLPRKKLPPIPPSSGFTRLSSRRLISLSGSDAATFLQGLTTASIAHPLRNGIYSAFLNAQGRVLHDVFIYPASHISAFRELVLGGGPDVPGYLIECDAEEQDTLFKWLARYKLRAKIGLHKIDEGEWSVWSVWDDEFYKERGDIIGPGDWSTKTSNTYASLTDSRAPWFGYRLLLPPGKHPSSLPRREDDNTHPLVPTTTEQTEVDEDSYRVRRILWGIPEGQQEIIKALALPLASNLDLMRGVDFRKGCYVGQELTIRTAHTGVVRKRILPVRLSIPGETEPKSDGRLEYSIQDGEKLGPLPESGADIVRGIVKRRIAGRWLGGVGNVGLALCRLESVLGDDAAADELVVKGAEGRTLRVTAFEPEWFDGRKDVGIRR